MTVKENTQNSANNLTVQAGAQQRSLVLASLGNEDTDSEMEHKPARNNPGSFPLFCCSVILKYLTSIHCLKRQLERGRNCRVCAPCFWILGRSMIVYLSQAKQVMGFFQILTDKSPITEPGRAGHTELGVGTGVEQVRNRLPWSPREYNYLMTAIYPFYSLQCQGNIACDSGNKSSLNW